VSHTKPEAHKPLNCNILQIIQAWGLSEAMHALCLRKRGKVSILRQFPKGPEPAHGCREPLGNAGAPGETQKCEGLGPMETSQGTSRLTLRVIGSKAVSLSRGNSRRSEKSYFPNSFAIMKIRMAPPRPPPSRRYSREKPMAANIGGIIKSNPFLFRGWCFSCGETSGADRRKEIGAAPGCGSEIASPSVCV
jgi:hypothetical protein